MIRRIAGSAAHSIRNFIRADDFITYSPAEGEKLTAIDTYGTYTYLVKTVDKSGNESESVVGYTFTSVDINLGKVISVYSEDSPSSNALPGIWNTNNTEAKFPSYQGGASVIAANGSSSNWTSPADFSELQATGEVSEYITQIRQVATSDEDVVAAYIHDITFGEKVLATRYRDQYSLLYDSNSEGTENSILKDSSIDGRGLDAIFSEDAVRYDSNNATLMSGGADGKVYAIRNPGQFSGDTTNTHSYALIASWPNNDNTIILGSSYYANGVATGSNSLSNVTITGNAYQLVDLTQYNDIINRTYEGEANAISVVKSVRTGTDYYANGNPNFTEQSFSSLKGQKNFKYFQIKLEVTNNDPEHYDYTLERFRYYVSNAR